MCCAHCQARRHYICCLLLKARVSHPPACHQASSAQQAACLLPQHSPFGCRAQTASTPEAPAGGSSGTERGTPGVVMLNRLPAVVMLQVALPPDANALHFNAAMLDGTFSHQNTQASVLCRGCRTCVLCLVQRPSTLCSCRLQTPGWLASLHGCQHT